MPSEQFRFTPENARLYSERAREKRRQRIESEKRKLELLASLAAQPDALFGDGLKGQIRKQIKSVADNLDALTISADPAKLAKADALTSLLSKLLDIDRKLPASKSFGALSSGPDLT